MRQHESLALFPWPRFDPEVIQDEEVLIVIQVNGKLRARITVGVHASEEEVKETVLANPRIRELVKDQMVKKFVLVPKKLVNVVV